MVFPQLYLRMELVTNLKSSILVFFCVYFFISGVDIYIILPTAWYYIRSLGFSKTFYGAVIAAQALGFILFSPVVGKISDRTRAVKLVLLACAAVKVTANFVYALPVSGYCPLVGYFFSGAANGAYSAMYGEIVRYTKNENRSKLFIVIESMFTFGASCGPLVGGMVTFNANILGLNINDGNSPAVVLIIIWSIIFCVLIWLPSDIGTKEQVADEVSVEGESTNDDSLMKSFNSTVWCLFFVFFLSALATVTCSANLPLLTMELFHLKLIHVKYLFGVGMIFEFLITLAAYKVTTYYSDHYILTFGIILQLPTVLLLCVYALLWRNVPFLLSYSLIIFICSGMSQITFAFVCCLLSKIIPSQHASTIQSLAMVDYNVATLLGRALSGLVFVQASLIVYSIGLLGLFLFGLAWLRSMFYRFSTLG